jgi:hypothetical protein
LVGVAVVGALLLVGVVGIVGVMGAACTFSWFVGLLGLLGLNGYFFVHALLAVFSEGFLVFPLDLLDFVSGVWIVPE